MTYTFHSRVYRTDQCDPYPPPYPPAYPSAYTDGRNVTKTIILKEDEGGQRWHQLTKATEELERQISAGPLQKALEVQRKCSEEFSNVYHSSNRDQMQPAPGLLADEEDYRASRISILIEGVLRFLTRQGELEAILGDVQERSIDVQKSSGISTARHWYRFQLLRSLPPFFWAWLKHISGLEAIYRRIGR